MPFLEPLHKVMNRGDLSVAEAHSAMELILRGEVSTPRLAAFLAALRVKGETAAELEGFARAMRAGCLTIDHGITTEPVLDIVGTGGDGLKTINVSTLAAFIVAACGIRVAKHGNRSISSACGAADVLETLGARLDLSPERVAASIRELGIGFLFAPALHPAMKHAMPARRELKTRTIFNILGPLTNPASATVLLVGAPSAHFADLMAHALVALGLRHGLVAFGQDGLDEVSLSAPTLVFSIIDGAVSRGVLYPDDFGFVPVPLETLRGGDPAHNAARIRALLDGEPGPQRDFVLANSAVALVSAHRALGRSTSLPEAVRLAAHAIDSGSARNLLHRFIEFTNR
ncbi:MAG: anthranilate phosphoribosyltransferase [Bryobacteraceae bacterium]